VVGRLITGEISSLLRPWSLSFFPRLEFRLAPCERKVAESDHVLDLPLHSDAEEGDEVHDEDRPEHRDVENLEKGTAESDHRGLGRRVPELELWQTPDERAEFFIL